MSKHCAVTPRSHRVSWSCIRTAFMCLMTLASATVAAAEEYRTVREALGAGAALLREGKTAESQAPLESALKLAAYDKTKIKVYRALLAAYRLLPEADKGLEAHEFIISKSDRDAERSLARRSLLSFIVQRGKVDDAVKRYEDLLKRDPNNKMALYILSEIYDRVKRDPKRSAELLQKLGAGTRQKGSAVDVRSTAKLARQHVRSGKPKEGAALYEKIAPLDPKLSAWHLKEAAAAWMKAGDKAKALAAAKASAASPPEKRSPLLTYYWHSGLADVLVKAGEPKLAVPHYEQAIEVAKAGNLQHHVKRCSGKLAEAKAATGE